jgi:hypothetical protein
VEEKFAFEDDEEVRLVMPFANEDGVYEVGMTGTICPLRTSLDECRRTDRYELNFEDGMRLMPSGYFERTAERKPGELRQGDRVKLSDDYLEDEKSVDTGTVICTHVKPEGILHDIALDYSGSIRIPHERVELLPGKRAVVEFSPEGHLIIDPFPGADS